ncbi:MAG: Hsp20/alpha crystallin family protein [Saprospiraceae bacterium]|nr:Hsp20/alpha crystallin family protein [Saprospiraceae bacterium]
MSLIKWTDREDFPTFSNVIEKFFNGEGGLLSMVSKGTSVPAVNISENKKAFEIELAVPGMSKEDFNISVEKDRLIVRSEKEETKEEKEKHFTQREYSYSSFYRSFKLPENANSESIDAKYDNGVLRVMIAKLVPSAPETRLIEIA